MCDGEWGGKGDDGIRNVNICSTFHLTPNTETTLRVCIRLKLEQVSTLSISISYRWSESEVFHYKQREFEVRLCKYIWRAREEICGTLKSLRLLNLNVLHNVFYVCEREKRENSSPLNWVIIDFIRMPQSTYRDSEISISRWIRLDVDDARWGCHARLCMAESHVINVETL